MLRIVSMIVAVVLVVGIAVVAIVALIRNVHAPTLGRSPAAISPHATGVPAEPGAEEHPPLLSATTRPTIEARRDYLRGLAGRNSRSFFRPPIFSRLGVSIPQPPANLPAELSPRRVTLHSRKALYDTLVDISQQVKIRFVTTQQGLFHDPNVPAIAIDADNQPLLDVLEQVCSQSGMSMRGDPSETTDYAGAIASASQTQPTEKPVIFFQPQNGQHAVGKWAAAGPCVYELQTIGSGIQGSQPNPAGAMITLYRLAEPSENLLYSEQLQVAAAIDGTGKSLAELAPPPNYANFGRSVQFILLDTNGADRHLKQLKLIDHVAVVTSSQAWRISPLAADSRSIGGMQCSISIANNGPGNGVFLTIRKGQRNTYDWNQLAPMLGGLSVRLLDDKGVAWRLGNHQVRFDEGQSTVNITWSFMQPPNAPESHPQTLQLTVPVEIRPAEIPIEFDDLPLP